MFNFKEFKVIYEVLTEERENCRKMAAYYAEQAAKTDSPEYDNARRKEYTDRLEDLNAVIAKIEATTF